jgi:hypothetical protein
LRIANDDVETSRTRRRVTGLLAKPSFKISKMSCPTERSSVPLSAALILNQWSSLCWFID